MVGSANLFVYPGPRYKAEMLVSGLQQDSSVYALIQVRKSTEKPTSGGVR
jgi:hypothetical protein